jgi:hypothetical protein
MMNVGVPGWARRHFGFREAASVTGDLHDDRSAGGGGTDEEGAGAWTPAERALLDAALDFYGAAEGVIDLAGEERPQVRRDAAGFEAVRRAMGVLEDRVRSAHAAGVAAERIAAIARIEREMVDLILQRDGAAGPEEGAAPTDRVAPGPGAAPSPGEG